MRLWEIAAQAIALGEIGYHFTRGPAALSDVVRRQPAISRRRRAAVAAVLVAVAGSGVLTEER